MRSSPHRLIRFALLGCLLVVATVISIGLLSHIGVNERKNALELGGVMLLAMGLLAAGVIEPVIRVVQREHKATAFRMVELERLSLAVKETSNGVVFTDAKGRVTWVNDGFVRMTGYSLQELLGRTPGSLLQCERSDPQLIGEMREALNAGLGYRCVIVNRRKDGSEFFLDMDIRPIHDSTGALTGFLAIELDVNEEVAHRNRLASTFATISEGVLLIASNGAIVECNASAERILGLSAEQLCGRRALDPEWGTTRRDGTPLPAHELPSTITLATGVPQQNMVHGVRLPDGSCRWISVNTVAVRDTQGDITGVVASFGDVTDALHEESRTELVVAAANLGTWDVHVPSGRVTFNAGFAAMLGYEVQELPGTVSMMELHLHPDERLTVLAALTDHTEGRSAEFRSEHRMRRKDGSWAWLLSAGKVTERGTGGEPIRIVGANVDISSAKCLEERAESAQKRYEAAVSGTSDGLWYWEIGATSVWFSPRCWTLLGYPGGGVHAAYTVSAFQESLHPDDRALALQRFEDAIRKGVPCDLEIRLRVLNAGYRHFRLRCKAQRAEGAHAARLAGSIQDMETQKQSESKLLLVTKQLEEAQAMSRLGSWSFDLGSGAIHWSKHVFSLLGRSEAAGPPVSMEDMLEDYVEEDRAHLSMAVQRLASAGESYSLTLRTRRGHDGTRYVRAVGRGKIGASGGIVELFGTITDVTAEVEHDEALRLARTEIEGVNNRLIETNRVLEAATARATEMAAQANRASHTKSEFLTNMSHEIRTPLTAILGYADVLRDELAADQCASGSLPALDTISRAGEHLLAIINDILDLSKIEAGKLQVERIETSLPRLLTEVDSLMRVRAASKGVTLRTHLATPVPDLIYSDPTRLRQVLLNLVGNAAKFTESGSISVRALIALAGDVQLLRIEIEDTGPGMSAEQARQLFQPFSQADASVTRRYGGTGLGLTICRRLAGLMGGDVRLDYTGEGRGSRFVLELPLVPVPHAATVHDLSIVCELPTPSASARQLPLPALTGRILLAEDGEDNQRLILFTLEKSGAQVTVAANGVIALELLEAAEKAGQPFDLLVTDIQMPEMDGYTLASTLRHRGNRMPIIALTAHAMADDRQKCLEAGCSDYATKPIDRRGLLVTCAQWLEHARNTDAIFPIRQPAIASGLVAVHGDDEILVSDIGDDPDLLELVDGFLDHLRDGMAAIEAHHASSSYAELRIIAHQLKGAAGGYGYMPISMAAQQVERAVSGGTGEDGLNSAVSALLAQCRAALRGRDRTVMMVVQS